MATFGLVHGAWHGAWCWEQLMVELGRRGHRAVAMDLSCEDRDAGFADYARTVIDALHGAGDVVLVGHSLGGMTIPLVAMARPVQALVFLCALIPDRVGDSAAGAPATHPAGAFDDLVHHRDGSHSWPTLEAATRTLYQDCELAQAAEAFSRLRRQQTAVWNSVPAVDPWPSAPSASIHCEDDAAISPEWSRWVAPRRLGVESRALPGGHSPMLSRPAALADLLIAVAAPPGGSPAP